MLDSIYQHPAIINPMTIIDQYISAHPSNTNEELADAIGITERLVQARRLALADKVQVGFSVSINDEINALANVIEVRKSGWAVDVAKERIRQLKIRAELNTDINFD
jgi:hypothetical protein